MRLLECPDQMRRRETCLGADFLQSERARAVAPNEVGGARKPGNLSDMCRSARAKTQVYHSHKCNRSALFFWMLNLRIDQGIEEVIQPFVQLGLCCSDRRKRRKTRARVDTRGLCLAKPWNVDVKHSICPWLATDRIARMHITRIHQNDCSDAGLQGFGAVDIVAATPRDQAYRERLVPVLRVASLAAILNGPRLNEWQRFIAPEHRAARVDCSIVHV